MQFFHQVSATDVDNYPRMLELWFLFSLIWSICASVDEDSRKLLDNYLRELEGQFPAKVIYFGYLRRLLLGSLLCCFSMREESKRKAFTLHS